jgi:hypothetical protein
VRPTVVAGPGFFLLHRRRLRSPPRRPPSEEEALAAENRLTAEQLAELSPGDVVTIESGLEFGRRRYATGRVARVVGRHIMVTTQQVPGGMKFVERYDTRDGVRVGGGTPAELVNAQPEEPETGDLLRRQTRQIDALYRAWSRRRGDVEALRELHAAIGAYLQETLVL